jgi:hypothetical protein
MNILFCHGGLVNWDYGRRGSAALTTRYPSIRNNVDTDFDKRRSLGRYSSLADQSHGFIIIIIIITTTIINLTASTLLYFVHLFFNINLGILLMK